MSGIEGSGRCACGVSVASRLGQACNEEAFRHFLSMERNRWRRSGHPFLLLLVRLKKRQRTTPRMDSIVAEKVFACLWLTLRATDQVGWFREGLVIGALLDDVCDNNVLGAVCEKVRGSLHAGLPPDIVARLVVRAFWLPSDRRALR
jgi:hypothetical protein